ncbi:MAG: PQQ-dependent sugar dehydrogenase [Planctomycetes bacterium]|nr:PQQ-dependent sugar dehydrogenase [Planctomycetota bacterium]MCB9906011.1 PQQ-dependent sugar dehydrogenase [Planctomycetota bacterium]
MLALPLLVGALFPQDTAPYEPYVAPASDEAETTLAACKVPAGFEITLWAAEPLLANPVAFHFDRFGTAWIAETFRLHAGVTDMREHMNWLHDELSNTTVAERVEMYRKFAGEDFHAQYETARDRVKRVVDTDGDGVADAANVYADRFDTAAAGIGAGVLATDDGVYYTCMPDLWLLADRNGDGVADSELQLSTGYGVHVALLGHDLHGLVIGPDRRLYFSCGDRGFNVLTQEGTRLYSPHTGAVLRCELDGSNLEVFHSGLRNPQELAFDDYGNLFTGDNNSDGGDQARFVQIVDGADTGWRFHYQYVTEPELRGPWNMEGQWKPWHAEQSAFLLPPIANVTSGPSGLTYYPGTGLSQRYRGHFFLCDFRGAASYSNVIDFPLVPKGAGFALGKVETFVDKVLATDVDFGPDSCLYVLDWVYGWGMTGKGRIYRVPPADEGERERARAVQVLLAGDWSARGADELRALLAHDDMRVRQAAQFALVDRGDEGRERLMDAALNGETQLARLHGLWGLGVLARKDQTLVRDLMLFLVDPDPELRAQAAKSVGDEFAMPAAAEALGVDFGPQLLETLRKSIADESPRIALYAALASARVARELDVRSDSVARAAAALLARAGTADPVLRHAGVMALTANTSSAEPDVLNGTDDGALFRELAASDDAHVRMGACLAARRHDSPVALSRFLDDPDVRIRREAARALHEFDNHSRNHSALLASQLARADRNDPTFLRFALVANWRMGTEDAARRVMEFCADDARPLGLRGEGMRMLAEWETPSAVDPIHGAWFPLVPRDAEVTRELALEFAARMDSAPDAVLQPWLGIVAAMRLRELESRVAAICSDTGRESATRVAALRTLEALFSEKYLEFVAAGVEGDDEEFRAACLEALPNLPRSQALPIYERVLASGSVSDRRAVYHALASFEVDRAAELLDAELAAWRDGSLPAALQLDLYRALQKRAPEGGVEALVAELWPERAAWGLALEGGNADRGRKLFESKVELSCLRCHPHQAGEVPSIGPSLDGVGERLTRTEILDSILTPNLTIAEGFDAQTLRMDDDAVLVGRVLVENEAELDLLDDQGEVWIVEKARIAERVPALSAMPTNLPDFLTPEEMRDLLEYLARR